MKPKAECSYNIAGNHRVCGADKITLATHAAEGGMCRPMETKTTKHVKHA